MGTGQGPQLVLEPLLGPPLEPEPPLELESSLEKEPPLELEPPLEMELEPPLEMEPSLELEPLLGPPLELELEPRHLLGLQPEPEPRVVAAHHWPCSWQTGLSQGGFGILAQLQGSWR